jgi:phytoene dehydrogenase-like protein
VGAGLGGLGTGVRLAGAGYRVTLLEKNERAGGKLNLVEAQGFSFDTGPSLITLPGVLPATFLHPLAIQLNSLRWHLTKQAHWKDGPLDRKR